MALSDSTIVLESVLATMIDGLIVIDSSGRIRLFNPACEKIFGYKAEEVIGENVSVLMPEPDSDAHDGYIARHQQTGKPHIIGTGREVEGRKKSGEVFPLYLSVGENKFPESGGYVGVLRDLTDASAQSRRMELLEATHSHLSRITAANQLGAAIAHELNQPLYALLNYMEAGMTLVEKRGTVSDDQLSEIMAKAADQAHKASRILARLRQFVERGDVSKAEVELYEACEAALSLVLPTYRDSGIEFREHCPRDIPTVRASRVQVEQVLVNLIRNACDAMKPMDESLEKVVEVSAECRGDEVCLTVSDTGPGMEPDQLARAFEPFYTTKTDGLGIGLSLCRDIIRSHGGTIEAQRNPTGGMIFVFTLPVFVQDS